MSSEHSKHVLLIALIRVMWLFLLINWMEYICSPVICLQGISGSNRKKVGLILERRNSIVAFTFRGDFYLKLNFNMMIHKLALTLLCLCAFASAQDSGGGQQEVGGTEGRLSQQVAAPISASRHAFCLCTCSAPAQDSSTGGLFPSIFGDGFDLSDLGSQLGWETPRLDSAVEQANSVSEKVCITWDFFWLQVWNNWSRSVYRVQSGYTSQLRIVEMRSGCRMSKILPRSLCKVIHSPKICSLLLKLVIVRPIDYLHPAPKHFLL